LDLKSPFLDQKRRSWIQERHFCGKNDKVGSEIAVFPANTPKAGIKTAFLAGKMAISDRIISFKKLKTAELCTFDF